MARPWMRWDLGVKHCLLGLTSMTGLSDPLPEESIEVLRNGTNLRTFAEILYNRYAPFTAALEMVFCEMAKIREERAAEIRVAKERRR